MNPEIEKLLIVQELDRMIFRLQEDLAKYPDFRKVRTAEIDRERTAVDTARAQIQELEKSVRSTDVDVRQMRENLRKLMGQQAGVKTQKEYDALTVEMQKIEQKIVEADEKGLESLTRQEALQARLVNAEKKLLEKEKEFAEEIQRLNGREAEKKSELEACQARREQAGRNVDPSVMRRYERLSQQYPGTCVAPVNDGNCGGCYIKILARRMQELTRPDAMAECDSCHRFLFLPLS